MSVRNSNDYYSYRGASELGALSKFAQVERRLSEKKQALEDMQNEYDLLEQQAFNTYKNNIDYLQLDQKSFIQKSKDWLSMLENKTDKDGNKLDGRKSYEEKDIYNWYMGKVFEYLNIDIKDVSNIIFMDFNFGQATFIKFTYKEHDWELEIPHIQNMNLKKYQDYGVSVFKLKLRHNDKVCCWSQVGSTFEEDELKDIMQAGLEKYGIVTKVVLL